MDKYDIGIVGAGVAGTFAALKAAESYKAKVILFELGHKPGKRRRFLEGFLGCFPTGDGKIYTESVGQVLEYVDGRTAKAANNWVMKQFDSITKNKIIKDKMPSVALQKRADQANIKISTNDYIQWKPESIHLLSKQITEIIEQSGNITFSFDNEVTRITKQKNGFIVSTSIDGDVFVKKLILCVGRSGWRWVNSLYKDFGLTIKDDVSSYGIYLECTASQLKELNRSHCTLSREDFEVGPFNWNGTIIPEDHADLVISAFRSNEDRWKSDKVSFSLIGHRKTKDGEGINQTDRLGKLAYLLFNDRIGKEKIKTIMKNDSPLSQLPEYEWLKECLTELNIIIPNLITKGSYHAPNISPLASAIRIGPNLETEIEDMFVAGESGRFKGISAAAITGTIAMESACKK